MKIKLGTQKFWFLNVPFYLNESQRRIHFHVCGLTGQGKSKFLAYKSALQILNGIPTAVVDPHSDLAMDVLSLLCQWGYFDNSENYNKFLYLDFAHPSRFVPFNLLNSSYQPHEVADHLIEVAGRVWKSLGDGQAPNLQNILLKSIPLLIENNLSLSAIERLLLDPIFRKQLLDKTTDQSIISFFRNRFDKWKDPVMANSTLNRAAILNSYPLSHIFGQQNNVLDFKKIINEGISVVANIGGLPEEKQKLLGCTLMIGFEKAALARASPGSPRSEYHVVVDEFTSFASASEKSFSNILSQARKYNLFLTLAHQHFSQVDSYLRGALENTGRVYFKLGYDDSVWASPRLFGFDPVAVKEAVSSTEKDVSTTTQFREQYESSARELYQGLGVREAYVRIGDKTTKIKTIRVDTGNNNEQVEQIKNYYSDLLLVPKTVENTVVFEAQSTRRKRKI